MAKLFLFSAIALLSLTSEQQLNFVDAASFSNTGDDNKITIFAPVLVCLPSEEVAHKHLSVLLTDLDYEVYVLRPDCLTDMISYAQTNVHVIEFAAVHAYSQLREILNTYKIDEFVSMHAQNCRNLLSNQEIMAQLRSIPFDLSIVPTWELCGYILSDLLGLKRIDFQVEAFMYPQLNRMYDFVYYDPGNTVPKSNSDDTFQVYLLVPVFDDIRQEYNVSLTQSESWLQNTAFLWIPSIPGLEYPNYWPPIIQFVGPVRSTRGMDSNANADPIQWLDALPSNANVLFVALGTLWHNMPELQHRDAQLFAALEQMLSRNSNNSSDNVEVEFGFEGYYIIMKSIHRRDLEVVIMNKYPDRIRIYAEWIPQTQIIQHSKVKLLICHGGYGTVQEGMYYGTPMIGIPFQFDQPLNIEKVTRIGICVPLNVHTFTSQQLLRAIADILADEGHFGRSRAWSVLMQRFDGLSVMKWSIDCVVSNLSDAFRLPATATKLKVNIIANEEQLC